MSTTTTQGHLFVIDGDLQGVSVDAWLLPTDSRFSITSTWRETMAKVSEGRLVLVRDAGWGSNKVVFLEKIDEADVWLGNVGLPPATASSREASLRHWVDCARSFVQDASKAVRQDPTRRLDGRLPIVAINHIGTGRGGARGDHARVLQALIDGLTAELDSGRLQADIVLVAWGEQPESASQYFRNQRFERALAATQWDFGPRTPLLHEHAKRLAGHLRNGSMSIFLGAGASAGAGLKDWQGLLTEIATNTGILSDGERLEKLGDLRDQASFIDSRLKRVERSLHGELVKHLSGAKFSLIHGLVASLPCNEFITTNVDTLFERACRTAGREITVMPHKSGDNRRWLLKLHGSIDNPETMVFTRENYLDAGRDSRALLGLVQAMLFTRHMLFIGYGLRDEDFHELVYEVRRAYKGTPIGEKIGTVLLLGPDPMKAEIWDDILEIVPVGTGDDSGRDARDVARFLDLVGMLSADKYRFFLDEAYNHEAFEPDEDLRSHLQKLFRLVEGRTGAAAAEVRALLARLGLGSP